LYWGAGVNGAWQAGGASTMRKGGLELEELLDILFKNWTAFLLITSVR